ncbi:MAG: hypothetical protein AB7O97_09145 [Planctomycetota bacterium]
MALFRHASPRRFAVGATDPWQLLRLHGEDLAAAARDILDRIGDANLVGVLVTPDAVRGDELRALLRRCSGALDGRRLCRGLLPREQVRVLLHDGFDGGHAARALHDPTGGVLPVLIATAIGFRTAAVPLPHRHPAAG